MARCNVGRSLIAEALCRLLAQEGFRIDDLERDGAIAPLLETLASLEPEDPSRHEAATPAVARDLTVAVTRLPHLAHFTDAMPLAAEPDVILVYAESPEELAGADLILLPGTSDPVADLGWLKAGGLADAIAAHSRAKGATIGLCGGYQMMGLQLGAREDGKSHEGIGILPVVTELESSQQTTLTAVEGISGLIGAWTKGVGLYGYEIHRGKSTLQPGARPAFRVTSRGEDPTDEIDGCMDRGGWTFGTCLYGLFDNDRFRRRFLNALRARRGLSPLEPNPPALVERERAFNRLAQAIREKLDPAAVLSQWP